MSDIHDRLRDAADKSGLTHREIARRAKLNHSFVSDMLANESDPGVEKMRKIAKVLGVSASWLISGDLLNSHPGLQEPQVEPWTIPASAGERPDIGMAQRQLLHALAPHARQPSTFRMRKTAEAFGLLSDDVLIVDLKGGEPKTGEIVVATVADLSSGNAETVVRRYLPPYLISADPRENEQPLVADGARTVVMGRVVASFRAPQLV